MDTTIEAHEARTKLPELLRRVAAGERFTITHRGQPSAELRPVQQASKRASAKAVAEMQTCPHIRGVGHRVVRALIEGGRR